MRAALGNKPLPVHRASASSLLCDGHVGKSLDKTRASQVKNNGLLTSSGSAAHSPLELPPPNLSISVLGCIEHRVQARRHSLLRWALRSLVYHMHARSENVM